MQLNEIISCAVVGKFLAFSIIKIFYFPQITQISADFFSAGICVICGKLFRVSG